MTRPQKNTMTKINTNTKTNTFREHIQIVIQETCDFWDIWWDWPTKRQLLRQWKRQSQRQVDGPWQRHDLVCELGWIVYIVDSCETWIQVYHCDLTIKSDTGQHLRFLQCLTNTDVLFETEGNLEGILCPNHHISDVIQRKGKSAHSSTLLRQRNVLIWDTHQLLIPTVQVMNFAMENN